MMENDAALIDLIYDAPFFPEKWKGVLDALSARTGARGGLLLGRPHHVNRFIFSDSIADMCEATGRFKHANSRGEKIVTLESQCFHADHDHFPPEAMANDPVYCELLWSFGLGYGAANHVRIPTGEDIIISIERARADGPMEQASVDWLTGMRPHLARAMTLATRMEFERIQTANRAFEATGLASAALSAKGNVVDCNNLFVGLEGLVSIGAGNRLRLKSRKAQAALDDCTALMMDPDTSNRHRATRSLAIPGDENRVASVMHLLPVRGLVREIFASTAFFLIITPAHGARDVPAAIIEGLFDLTVGEARIARALAEGRDVNAIAAGLGIRPQTVRDHLKAIYAKTGFGHQAELAAAIASIPSIG